MQCRFFIDLSSIQQVKFWLWKLAVDTVGCLTSRVPLCQHCYSWLYGSKIQYSLLLKPQQPGDGLMAQWYPRGHLTTGSEHSQLGNFWKWFPDDNNSCVWRNCFWEKLLRMCCLEQWQPSSNHENPSLRMAMWQEGNRWVFNNNIARVAAALEALGPGTLAF